MRGRLFTLVSCLLLSISPVDAVHAASLTEQRRLYDQAKAALAKGNSAPCMASRSALCDYPLEPYLAYDKLTHRPKSTSNEEVERFLTEYGDLPRIGQLKLRWLRLLVDRGDWRTFVNYYGPKLNFTELDCLHGQYQPGRDQKAEGHAAGGRPWLVGKSRPAACDTLFGLWQGEGQLTEEKVWKRLKLAAEAHNYNLASHLAQRLPTLGNQDALMVSVTQNPTQLSQTGRFSQRDHAIIDVVSLGLRRLVRQDPEKALSLLDYYSSALPFSSDEKVAVAREIGLSLAERFDPRALPLMTQYDPGLRNNTVTEWHTRLLLRLDRWNEAYALTRKLPQNLAATSRWRCQQARGLQLAQPNSKEPIALYQKLAGERDFYGFLAADRLSVSYKLGNRPAHVDPRVLQCVHNAASTRRAMESFNRDEVINARHEWYYATCLFDRDEPIAQARLAYDMQWYFPAICSISQAQYWDSLDIRFSMTYRATLVREAKNRGLHSS